MKKVICILALTLTGCGLHYSDGERVGYITKFSRKGLFWKTWEGEMRIGGMTNGSGAMQAELWDFTVRDGGPIKEIEAAMKSGEKVDLKYSQDLYIMGIKGETNHFVTEVVR